MDYDDDSSSSEEDPFAYLLAERPKSYSIAADPPVPRSLRPSAQRIFASRGRLERHSPFVQPSHLTVSLDWEIGPGSQEPGPLLPLSFADV